MMSILKVRISADLLVLFSFVVLLRIPQLFPAGLSNLLSVTLAALVAVFLGFRILQNRFALVNVSKSRLRLVLLFLALELLSLIRAGVYGVIDPLTAVKSGAIAFLIVGLMLSINASVKSHRDLESVANIIAAAFLFIIFENITLWLLGVEAFKTGQEYSYVGSGVLFGVVGLAMDAVIFPLEAGPKALSVIACYLATFFMSKALMTGRFVIYLSLYFTCVFFITAADARVYMAIALLSPIIPLMIQRIASTPLATLLGFLFPIMPIFLLFLAVIIDRSGLLADISRSAVDNISTLSSRTLIWGSVGVWVLSFAPELIYGYGAAGTVLSGVNDSIAFIFDGGWTFTGIKTAHNAFLQQLLDKGLFGVLVFAILLWSILKTFLDASIISMRAHAAGLIAVGIACSTNTVFYYANVESYVLFWVLAGLHLCAAFDAKSLKPESN